jgi:hypothetical protein
LAQAPHACLPDFQGVGIDNAMSEFVASLFVATGKPHFSSTSHPRDDPSPHALAAVADDVPAEHPHRPPWRTQSACARPRRRAGSWRASST